MNNKVNLNEIPNLKQYNVGDREWFMQTDLTDLQEWSSRWVCGDGDVAELYILKNKDGFTLNCFSGIPASDINVDQVDFGVLWNKAFDETDNKHIQNYSHIQKCLMIADWLCSIFCTWIEKSKQE